MNKDLFYHRWAAVCAELTSLNLSISKTAMELSYDRLKRGTANSVVEQNVTAAIFDVVYQSVFATNKHTGAQCLDLLHALNTGLYALNGPRTDLSVVGWFDVRYYLNDTTSLVVCHRIGQHYSTFLGHVRRDLKQFKI